VADADHAQSLSPLPAEVRLAIAFTTLVSTIYEEYGTVTERTGKALQRVIVAGVAEGAWGQEAWHVDR
jgi:hypothetical protein